jgi:hypothetical protein
MDQEEINRRQALEILGQRIGGCFGTADGIFARHLLEQGRAAELLQLASDNRILLSEIEGLARAFLQGPWVIETTLLLINL